MVHPWFQTLTAPTCLHTADGIACIPMTAKIALVTGAGSGIGRAVSLALYSAGYSVVLAGRRAAELEKTAADAKRSNARLLAVPADVSQPDSVRALFAKAIETF